MAQRYRDFDHHEVVRPFLYVRQDDLHQVYQDVSSLLEACRPHFPTANADTIVGILQVNGCTVETIRSAEEAEALRPVLAISEDEFQALKTAYWEALDRSFPGADLVDWVTTKSFLYVDRTRRRRVVWCRGDDIDIDLPTSDPAYFTLYDRVSELLTAYGQRVAADLDADYYL